MTKNPNIFLSYSWKDKEIVDQIDEDFQRIGILMQRDVRDGQYRKSIKQFMQNVRHTDYVLTVISDEFLKSENCMYELLELFQTRELGKRILPIVLENAKIFDVKLRSEYYDYWDNQIDIYKEKLIKYTSIDFQEHLTHARNIRNQIPEILSFISDLNVKSFSDLKTNNYLEMLNLIGFEEESILSEALRIRRIEEKEDRDLALEELIEKYPKNRYVLFYKAFIAEENGQFKKAKKYYKLITTLYPDYAIAQNNFGLILHEQFNNWNEARFHYEKALEFNPRFAKAHYNLALLLKNGFHDYNGSKKHYEEAIRLNPEDPDNYSNYALLLKNNFQDYVNAKLNYEAALKIRPNDLDARNNYAVLLESGFQEYKKCSEQYEIILNLNPEYYNAHYNYAKVLKDHLKDYSKAKSHYEAALNINSEFTEAYVGYANLLMFNLNEYGLARVNYEKALKLNEASAETHFDFSLLLANNLNDKLNARIHYSRAIQLNPALRNEKFEKKL